MTKFEPGKEYRTRDGSRARVYATDAQGELPIHGAVFYGGKEGWKTESWTTRGAYIKDGVKHRLDLMPPVREWWLYGCDIFDSFEAAEECRREEDSGLEIIPVREVTDE